MNLLLDTHTVIWFLNGDQKLSEKARSTIDNVENNNYVSTVSIWEIAIKISLGKLEIKGSLPDIKKQFKQNGFELLPIDFDHVIALQEMPLHHRDPFDRMIIAQAKVSGFTILTKDPHFHQYDIPVVW